MACDSKIELSFKQAVQTIGAYAYHFWMKDMKPLRRWHGDRYLHRESQKYREHVKRKIDAYHRFVQAGHRSPKGSFSIWLRHTRASFGSRSAPGYAPYGPGFHPPRWSQPPPSEIPCLIFSQFPLKTQSLRNSLPNGSTRNEPRGYSACRLVQKGAKTPHSRVMSCYA